MRRFKKGWLKTSVAQHLRLQALKGTNNGQVSDMPYVQSCMASYQDEDLTHYVQFTRDRGMHDCGWWKNPTYNQCFQLSLSFRDVYDEHVAQQHDLAREWTRLFFGEHVNLLWIEPPYYEAGKIADVYHYRLLTNLNWQPIMPQGEVYSTDWTPKGWLSFSDLQSKLRKEHQDAL